MKKPMLLVVGSANMDLVARAPRCPNPGETVSGSGFKIVPGGKGANQAIAAARLDGKVYFSGCVGTDEFGMTLIACLTQAGVDISHLKGHTTAATGTAMIVVNDAGENTIVVTPAANMAVTPAHIDTLAPLFGSIDGVLMQLETPLESVDATLDMAQRYGVPSFLDAGPARPLPDELIEKVTVLSPNWPELETLVGTTIGTVEEAIAAGKTLRERGAQYVVLKLGSEGSCYIGDGAPLHVPAFDVRAVDTVAAGDAFTAALATRWGQLEPLELLRFANAAGALASTVEGAQPAMPKLRSVQKFLDAQKEAAS